METDFGVEALSEAIRRYGSPDIFNTDQGSPFTSEAFTNKLKDNHIAISMDGRGRCQGNIFIERLWWTLKHHDVYLHSFANGVELREGHQYSFNFYNKERFHQSLDNVTPDEVYYNLHQSFAEAA